MNIQAELDRIQKHFEEISVEELDLALEECGAKKGRKVRSYLNELNKVFYYSETKDTNYSHLTNDEYEVVELPNILSDIKYHQNQISTIDKKLENKEGYKFSNKFSNDIYRKAV